MTNLATKEENGIVRLTQEPIRMLDARAPGGVVVYDATIIKPQWAACISLGKKAGDNPASSKKDDPLWIHLHEDMGDAPGIRAALAATNHKSLTVTMISDNINECWVQSYAAYGSRKISGDEKSLTVMKFSNKTLEYSKTFYADEPKGADGFNNYDKALAECRVQYWLQFVLCEWGDDGRPRTIYNDGFGLPYRFRTGSKRTFESLVASMQAVQALNGGRLAGVPFTLKPAFPNALTPQGERRRVVRMQMSVCPPGGVILDNAQLRRALNCALEDRNLLALPAPIEMTQETRLLAMAVDDNEIEADDETGEVVNTKHSTIAEQIATTGTVTEIRVKDYFRATQNTPFTDDKRRPGLVQRMADAAGVVIDAPSLTLLASVATVDEWEICTEVFCKAAAAYLGTEETKAPKVVVGSDDPYAQEQTPSSTPTAVTETVPPVSTAAPEVPKETLQEDRLAREEKPTETNTLPDQTPRLPKVRNYLALDRQPNKAEQDVATAYIKECGMSQEQFVAIGKASGGINVLFVILQARQDKLTAFADIMRLVDESYVEFVASDNPQAGLHL